MICNIVFVLVIVVVILLMLVYVGLGKLKDLVGVVIGIFSSSVFSVVVLDEVVQEVLVCCFVSLQLYLLQVQILFVCVFGLVEQVQLLEVECQVLLLGLVSVDVMKKLVLVSEVVQVVIDECQVVQLELNVEFKQYYVEGLVLLLVLVVEVQKLGGEVSNFIVGMKNLGVIQMVIVGCKLVVGVWVVKELLGFIQGLYGLIRLVVIFVKKSKVKVLLNVDLMFDLI